MQFLECHVLICDFHREQAWERWTKKSESNVGHNREEVLALMRNVAKAETEDLYQEALTKLKESNAYKSNPKLQKYFVNTWLVEKEVSPGPLVYLKLNFLNLAD